MSQKTPSVRQRKINSFLRRKLNEMLAQGVFVEFSGFVTVLAVETTPDLREAKVWFSVYGENPERVLRELNEHHYEIQGRLYKGASMRIMPKISFYLDRSGEKVEHLQKIFNRLHDE